MKEIWKLVTVHVTRVPFQLSSEGTFASRNGWNCDRNRKEIATNEIRGGRRPCIHISCNWYILFVRGIATITLRLNGFVIYRARGKIMLNERKRKDEHACVGEISWGFRKHLWRPIIYHLVWLPPVYIVNSEKAMIGKRLSSNTCERATTNNAQVDLFRRRNIRSVECRQTDRSLSNSMQGRHLKHCHQQGILFS